MNHDQNFAPSRWRGVFALAAYLLAPPIQARAEPVQIVALGASHTAGKGLAQGQAFPAQLQTLLRERGYDARVTNAGVSGETTNDMLQRLTSAVPPGTAIVILQPGGNDLRRAGDAPPRVVRKKRNANVGALVRHLEARHVRVILLTRQLRVAAEYYQADGEHLTPAGYRIVAERLLPDVVAAIGRAR